MVNVILKVLRGQTSTVDATKVTMTGATELRQVFSSDQMEFILTAYMQGLQAAFLVAVIASSVATIVCMAVRWVKLSGAATAVAA